MKVSESFVSDHKEEIKREAFRLHNLRKDFCPEIDEPYNNFITAITNVYKRYEIKNGIKKDN